MTAASFMFNNHEIRTIASQASTIDERLLGRYVPIEDEESRTAAKCRLDAWVQMVAKGHRETFVTRLKRDGLTEASLLPYLGKVRLPEGMPLPSWASLFRQVTDRYAPTSEALSGDALNICEANDSFPFGALVYPFVTHAEIIARSRCSPKDLYPISSEAFASMRTSLLKRLTDLFAPILFERFYLFRLQEQPFSHYLSLPHPDPSGKDLYNNFLCYMFSEGMKSIFVDLPVFARLLGTVVDQWIQTYAEILSRLRQDLDDIRLTFTTLSASFEGCIKTIDCNLSDFHNNGRSVARVAFHDGTRVLYKPKCLEMDAAWAELLSWCERNGAPERLEAPRTLPRSGYGWCEFISKRSCRDESDVRRFYRRSGVLLCLVNVFSGTDLHLENIIADRDNPILVDVESLMQPKLKVPIEEDDLNEAMFIADEKLRKSVLATGYLPNWSLGRRNEIVGLGGLNPVADTEGQRLEIQYMNRNGMELKWCDYSKSFKEHAPELDSKPVSVSMFLTEVMSGFEDMYRFLSDSRHRLCGSGGPLDKFHERIIRVIFRPTSVYELILRRSLQPRNLREGVDWSIHFDFLCRMSAWDKDTDPLWPILSHERDALSRLDIPFFFTSTDRTLVKTYSERDVGDCVCNDSFRDVAERIYNLSANDMESNLELIEHAISSLSSNGQYWNDEETSMAAVPDMLSASDGEFLHEAESLAAMIESRTFYGSTTASWLCLGPIGDGSRVRWGVMGSDLYGGVSGIALFLGALWHLTCNPRYRDLAIRAIASVRRDLKKNGRLLIRAYGIGLGSGVSGLIYTLAKLAVFCEDTGLLDEAVCACKLLDKESWTSDTSVDLLTGIAGAVVAVLNVYSQNGDSALLEIAMMLGRTVLSRKATLASGLGCWRTVDDIPLTGMSHGNAGIALSLLRLYEASGEREFYVGATEGINYERSTFSSEQGWPDLRKFDAAKLNPFPNQWCHGAAGIGLARLGGRSSFADEHVAGEIDFALRRSLSKSTQVVDHLCCGNFGRIEFMFSAGLKLGCLHYIRAARGEANELMLLARKRGRYRWISGLDSHNHSFFTGSAGVGYELLRLISPDRIPSVLLFE